MGVLVPVAGDLLSLDDAERLAKDNETKILDVVTSSRSLGRGLEIRDLPKPLSKATLQRLRDDLDATKPFLKIGPNRPLTMVLESAYLGDLPDASRFNPFVEKGDVLVTSSNRPFSQATDPARAIHFLQPRARSRTRLTVGAGTQGTQLMYYSPAVVDVSIVARVEMIIDRDFDEALTDKIGAVLGGAAALPVFAPAAPYLLGASIAVPLAGKFANIMMQPNVFFSCVEEINIDRAGPELSEAGALVLYPGQSADEFKGYELAPRSMRLTKDGKEYKGDLPYAVMTLDGTERKQWEGWQAAAMSADMVQRFLGSGDALSGALDVVSDGLGLYNDMTFQKRALDVKKKLKAAESSDAKDKLQAELEALTKNIRNEELRKTVEV